MKPIYTPKGAAAEYGDYAINIYTGCPHRCYYCFAQTVIRRDREIFHSHVEPREGIVEAVKSQLAREQITGKTIHLCFTCDPYPTGYDTTPTREIIKAIKESGNHVQILTKGDGSRDFDLLDENDWYGITLSHFKFGMDAETEPGAISSIDRYSIVRHAKAHYPMKTWVSLEPVLDQSSVLELLRSFSDCFDKIKIGKLNYWPSDINWKNFGSIAEFVCKQLGVDYYIKDSLRAEMEKVQEK